MNTIDKIQTEINVQCERADKFGRSKLSVCNAKNWDTDLYDNQNKIVSAIRDKGYNVEVSINFGVTDILIIKP